jgi:hypothetical protein
MHCLKKICRHAGLVIVWHPQGSAVAVPQVTARKLTDKGIELELIIRAAIGDDLLVIECVGLGEEACGDTAGYACAKFIGARPIETLPI